MHQCTARQREDLKDNDTFCLMEETSVKDTPTIAGKNLIRCPAAKVHLAPSLMLACTYHNQTYFKDEKLLVLETDSYPKTSQNLCIHKLMLNIISSIVFTCLPILVIIIIIVVLWAFLNQCVYSTTVNNF